jgi:anaerobic ribonucleoside-triphosphate reductase activating protein
MLSIAQVVCDTEAEGPGRRFAVWVQGCPMRCPGCCNPEMLRFEGGEQVDAIELARRALAVPGLDGVTLLGGEPFAQAPASARFSSAAKDGGLHVMVFSGFTLAELEAMRSRGEPGVGDLLGACDVLVDGRYDRERPDQVRRFIGSTNQVRHVFGGRYRPDDPCWTSPNTVEIRLRREDLVVNGWPSLAAAVVQRRTTGHGGG